MHCCLQKYARIHKCNIRRHIKRKMSFETLISCPKRAVGLAWNKMLIHDEVEESMELFGGVADTHQICIWTVFRCREMLLVLCFQISESKSHLSCTRLCITTCMCNANNNNDLNGLSWKMDP